MYIARVIFALTVHMHCFQLVDTGVLWANTVDVFLTSCAPGYTDWMKVYRREHVHGIQCTHTIFRLGECHKTFKKCVRPLVQANSDIEPQKKIPRQNSDTFHTYLTFLSGTQDILTGTLYFVHPQY